MIFDIKFRYTPPKTPNITEMWIQDLDKVKPSTQKVRPTQLSSI